MSRRLGVALFLSLALLFLFVNREAYSGYFQDDEIDILSWVRYAPASEYLKASLSPKFEHDNFRPVGHFYFREAERVFGLNFAGYVAVLHAIHLLNVWLLWLVARRLGAAPFSAAAACLLFAFHMALFDVLWKPMYVFDLLCATFCLASLLLYARGQWVLAFAAFWLAYKAKELAVMLPLALACYEFWFGKRRWMRLAPFFLASLSFGLQALLLNPNRDNDYTFRFTTAALTRTVRFYSAQVFLVPYLGLLVPVAALVWTNRRTWFGLAMMALFFLPLLFLSGRIFSAYCYLPFTGLALAFAGIADGGQASARAALKRRWSGDPRVGSGAEAPRGRKPTPQGPSMVLFLLLALPQDVHVFRLKRRETLARDREIRSWITAVANFAKTGQHPGVFLYDGAPNGFARWGVEGAVKYLFPRMDIKVQPASEPMPATRPAALLRWNAAASRLDIETLQ
jgi:hypothetical protein